VNRRVLGRGRAMATLGAILTLVGCVLPWYTTAGVGLPATSINAFDGPGILVFMAAIGIIAMVLLPYAAGDQRLGLDRPLAFALVAGLGAAGLLLKIIQQAGQYELRGMFPDRALGLWVAAVGIAIIAWGTAEVARVESGR
jgi:hypothetical protein